VVLDIVGVDHLILNDHFGRSARVREPLTACDSTIAFSCVAGLSGPLGRLLWGFRVACPRLIVSDGQESHDGDTGSGGPNTSSDFHGGQRSPGLSWLDCKTCQTRGGTR